MTPLRGLQKTPKKAQLRHRRGRVRWVDARRRHFNDNGLVYYGMGVRVGGVGGRLRPDTITSASK